MSDGMQARQTLCLSGAAMRIFIKPGMIFLAALCAMLWFLPATVRAEGNPVIGKIEYELHCAACHGRTGKGDDSILKSELVKPVPDLTLLARKNKGVFPDDFVFQTIDGRNEIKSHGNREMPVWGAAFKSETAPEFKQPNAESDESLVRSRILDLIEYLRQLQAK